MACSGAGVVERIHLNTPRDIVFDHGAKILSKPSDDPVFYGVQDLTLFWGRFMMTYLIFLGEIINKQSGITVS